MLNWIRTAVRPLPPIFGNMPGPKLAICDSVGNSVGFVDAIDMRRSILTVSGWVVADRVQMVLGGLSVATVPDQLRPDVAQERGLDPLAGFTLSLKVPPTLLAQCDPPGLIFTPKTGACDIPALSFTPHSQRRSMV